MKTLLHVRTARITRMRPLAQAITLALSIYSGSALAQVPTVTFSTVPLTVAQGVPPNLLYIHDDSNSMYFSYMPDEIHWISPITTASTPVYGVPMEFYRAPTFNKMYYNPAFKYVPPPAPPNVEITGADGKTKVTDGTLGNADFTGAWHNGYDLKTRNSGGNYISDSTGTIPRKVNLSTSFKQTDYTSRIFGTTYYVSGHSGFPIDGKRPSGSTVYWSYWYNGTTGPGEFLPMSAEAAHYYSCPASAWVGYPSPTVSSGNFKKDQCTRIPITTPEEKQNFANWYSYYRTRNYASKAGIGRAFEKLDPTTRLGWGLINKASNSTVDGNSVNTVQQGVREYDTTRKKEFYEWLYNIQPASMYRDPFISPFASQTNAGGTPLRRALEGAGQYYDRRSSSSTLGPWAKNPASPGDATKELAAQCRKSFTLLMTDGYWNLAGASINDIKDKNVDGKAGSPFQDGSSDTLADIAWYYWVNDLAPKVANRVPQTLVAGTESLSSPKVRDKATYQHMTTFTIGLGVAPKSVTKEAAFYAIVTGANISWPSVTYSGSGSATNAIDDLLHTGFNGHGDFFAAADPDEFINAMDAIINAVNMAQKSSGGLSVGAEETNSSVHIYKTNYMPGAWSGELTAQWHTATDGLGTDAWRASEKMPAPKDRKIYTLTTIGPTNNGEFVLSKLNNTQQTALTGGSSTLNAQKVLDYVRGSNADEGEKAGQFRIRHRADSTRAPLAHSPHNTPLYDESGGQRIVYLGANDGMLHAFDATTGVEKFAYIPAMLIPNLHKLVTTYDYYVDGELVTANPTTGKHFLVGALGRGGKGLFGLDVTAPATFSGNNIAWELNGENCADATSPKYLGNVVSALNTVEVKGVPSIVFGNGYNSCNDKAALGIVRASDGDATFIKASDDTGNGLASPALWRTSANDLNAYAGDLRGTLWRFGLEPTHTSKNLFDAGTSKPITARPMLTPSDVTGSNDVYLLFGTGRYLTISDKSSTSAQSIYTLIDSDGTTIAQSDLKQRSFTTNGTINGAAAKTIEVAVKDDLKNKKGWFINLTDSGERVVNEALVVPTEYGDVAVIASAIPPMGADPCDTKGSGWLYFVDAKTGGALDFIFLDLSGDREFGAADTLDNNKQPSAVKIGDWMVNGKKFGMLGQIKLITHGKGEDVSVAVVSVDGGGIITLRANLGSTGPGAGRISWREIVK